MIDWLHNFQGKSSTSQSMEKAELETLRKEMSKYKRKYKEDDDEMNVPSHPEVI